MLTQRYGDAVLEKALANRPEIGPCPGPKGFHEWEDPESLWGGYARVELWKCRYCSVHLLSDLRGRKSDYEYMFFSEKPDPDWDLISLDADPTQCDHRCHEDGVWVEYCPECGVTAP